MPFVPVPNVARVEMLYTLGTSYVENVLWFEAGLQFHVDELEALCSALQTWYTTSLRPAQSQQVVLNKIIARDWSEQNGQVYELPVNTNNAGQRLGGVMPGNVTLAVKFNTGLAGRSYRGRNYALGLTEDACMGDSADATFCNLLKSAYETMGNNLFTSGFTHVVASLFHNKAPRNLGVATAVNSYTVESVLDSQRRRLSGRGR